MIEIPSIRAENCPTRSPASDRLDLVPEPTEFKRALAYQSSFSPGFLNARLSLILGATVSPSDMT